MNEILNPVDNCSASVIRGAGHTEKTGAWGHFDVVCYGPDGQVRWVEEIDNQVMNEGKNVILDAALAGSTYTVNGPKMGLVTNTGFSASPGYQATDTYTVAHTAWSESPTAYTARQAVTWSNASGGTKAAAQVTFSIIATDVIRGCVVYFTASTSPTNVSAGSQILSAGDFTGGNKNVGSGDTIQVSYTFGI